jgi:Gamma-glutamyl cyclotransferase, AIG2-like
MALHFAYGSNMSRALMRRRCPTAEAAGLARLDGWRFICTHDGYASIVPALGSAVHGVLWRLTPRDLAALNAYESLDSGLYQRRVLPVRQARRIVPALAYVGRSPGEGRPRPGYQDAVVVPAARDWGLPPAYIAELARWSPSAWRAARAPEPGAPA